MPLLVWWRNCGAIWQLVIKKRGALWVLAQERRRYDWIQGWEADRNQESREFYIWQGAMVV
jgi:hypothetical protein